MVSSTQSDSNIINKGVPHLSLLAMSLAAAVLSVIFKVIAWRLTGSVGLLSDAAESCVNVVAALTALFALWYSSQPADRSHPYGHEKIEFFASGVEGALILAAAALIAYQATLHFQHTHLPDALGVGIAFSLVSTAINFCVARVLLETARRTESIILEADGRHLMSDVWTTLGVVAGLFLVKVTHLPWIDPLIALIVAANIVRIGYDLVRRSFDGLMDRALDDETVTAIRDAISSALRDDMTYHALRTRRAGAQRFVDYHLLVPGDCSVAQAHDFELRAGRAIESAVPGVEITAHIEPLEEPLAWNDSRLNDAAPPREFEESLAQKPLQ
jgi:cation diffusion facilitator family transporter